MYREHVQPLSIGNITVGRTHPPVLFIGLCVLQDRDHALFTAEALQNITQKAGFQMVFKASYDKANRTSVESYRGPGIDEGLKILCEVREKTGMPVLTDVHEVKDVAAVGEAVDCLQIPAFLCRQTDMLVAAGITGKPVNVKKGQFMAPDDMTHVIKKIQSTGNDQILLTERGSSFGYHNLVVDMRSLGLMRAQGCPVVFDATHSVQLPSGAGGASGGDRRFAGPLARAAVAMGVDALFLETHEDPDCALCDGPNSLAFDALAALLEDLRAISAALQH